MEIAFIVIILLLKSNAFFRGLCAILPLNFVKIGGVVFA